MRRQGLVAVMIIGVLAFAGASTASAQPSVSTSVTVPFQFIVGEQLMPAGQYSVTTVGEGSSVLMVTNGKLAATVIGNFAEEPSDGIKAVFTFTKIDGQCFLSKVNAPGTSARVIPLPRSRVDAVLSKVNGTKPAPHGRPTV